MARMTAWVLALGLSLNVGAAARKFQVPQVALPLMQRAPVVDGAIGEEEWGGAARWVGLCDLGKSDLSQRHAVVWLGSDGNRVYFAFKTEAPPEGLITVHEAGEGDEDTKAFRDDSVEVFFDIDRAASPAKGVYQGVFNAAGAIYDSRHQPPANWRGAWQLANRVIDGWWHYECSIPLASMGARAPLVGQTWGFRLVRDWKAPWQQSPLSPLASHFADRGSMAAVSWSDTAPVVQMLDHRTPDGKKVHYTMRVHNPHTKPVAIKVRIDSQCSESQHTYLDEAYTVAPGQSEQIELKHHAVTLDESIYTRIHVTSPGGEAVYYHREYSWSLARPEKIWGKVQEALGPLAKIKKALTFHASFDSGIDADFAKGDAKGSPHPGQGGKVQLVEGASGKALLSGAGGATVLYTLAENFGIDEGTLSLWIRPLKWLGPGQGDKSHAIFQTGRPGKGYFGFQMARHNAPGPYLQWYMIQYPWRSVVAMNVTDDVPEWTEDQWHWLVMTWTTERVSFYVDGRRKGSKGFNPPLGTRDLTAPTFQVGKSSGGPEATAIDEVMIFDRCFSDSELRQARLFCRSSTGAAAWEAVQFDFGHYPYYKRLKARVDINGLQGKESVSGATLALRTVGAADPLATLRLPAFEDFATEIIAAVPELPDGQYQLSLRLQGGPKELEGELVREFARKVFPWEHTSIGTSDRILKPFTPLRVAGRVVHTVLREHTIGAQGLWDQVVTAGEPLLAAPMRFEAWVDGKPVPVKPERSDISTPQELGLDGCTRATVRSEFHVGQTRASMTSRIDYDGLMHCTLELTGDAAGATLDRLDLVIPVTDAMAPLAHICGERLRQNFAGYLPKGAGVVWDASTTVKHELIGPFCPYIWVGAEERGICWFGENDRGWVVDGETPCQEIERQAGVLTIRVRLVQKPTALPRTDGLRMEFGLQATPVKPMPEHPRNWRTWSNQRYPGAMTYTIAGSTYYYGVVFHEPFPNNYDLTLWQKFGEARRTGEADRAFVKTWIDAYPAGLFEERPRSNIESHVHGGFNMVASQPDRMLVYIQGRGATFWSEEFKTFQDEWSNTDYNTRVWRSGLQAGLSYTVEPVPSWQDHNLWWLKQQMETFTDGLYFDNFFTIPVTDRVLSNAYKKPDGRIQPAVPVGNMRQMMRRTSTMYIEAGRHPMIGPHMTNATLVPVMAFAQFGLDWEWHYGRSDYQERWSRDHIRAACIGRQTGCAPIVIAIGSRGADAEEVEWLNRTFNGVVLTHELIPSWYTVNRHIPAAERKQRTTSRDWYFKTHAALVAMGYGTAACRTHNYWDRNYPLAVTGVDASSILHRGKDRTAIVITDWGDGGTARLALDLPALGVKVGASATDFETGEALAWDGDALTVSLKKHDYVTVVVAH